MENWVIGLFKDVPIHALASSDAVFGNVKGDMFPEQGMDEAQLATYGESCGTSKIRQKRVGPSQVFDYSHLTLKNRPF